MVDSHSFRRTVRSLETAVKAQVRDMTRDFILRTMNNPFLSRKRFFEVKHEHNRTMKKNHCTSVPFKDEVRSECLLRCRFPCWRRVQQCLLTLGRMFHCCGKHCITHPVTNTKEMRGPKLWSCILVLHYKIGFVMQIILSSLVERVMPCSVSKLLLSVSIYAIELIIWIHPADLNPFT